jgi:protein-disulfide isomerase
MRSVWIVWIALGMSLLAACAAPQAREDQGAQLIALPTVTPMLAETAAPVISVPLNDATPRPTAAPTSTPGVVYSAEGPVTASMAQLGLRGERVAALGDPEAPITVVEFADYGCEFCRRYHLFTFRELRRTYIDTGQVYYVFKDLPIVSNQGAYVAEAALCAGEQGLFWEFHAALFAEPERWMPSRSAADATFAALAADLTADSAALQECLASERYAAAIAADVAEAQALRVFGTPAFFINGKLLSGAQPINVWQAVLAEELE